MTITEIASRAIFAQSACNLSGVLQSWANDVKELRKLCPNASTGELNQHPINRLYAEQVLSLTGGGSGNGDTYSKAYDACKNLSKGS